MRVTVVRQIIVIALLLAIVITSSGCSVKRMAINKVGNALANGGTTYASDDDPVLVGEALPFSLKLIESLLAESPNHRGMLFAASSGFTQYAFVYVQQDADEIESQDVTRAGVLRNRAKLLYLRARNYGLRGLAVRHPGFENSLKSNPKQTLSRTKKSEVPLLYWTAVSWGAAIGLSKDDPDLVADQPIVEALIDRALALDPEFDSGAIHNFLITYESARQGAKGDFAIRAKEHFDKAVELSGGKMAAPFVSYAETVSISKQNREEFESLLKRSLAIDPNGRPEWRLANLVTQRHARWLLAREDQFFMDTTAASPSEPSKAENPE
jgi:predicted anti-sigma-YlaC factor YlaD